MPKAHFDVASLYWVFRITYSPAARTITEKTTRATKFQRSLALNFVEVFLLFPVLDPVFDDFDAFPDVGSKNWRRLMLLDMGALDGFTFSFGPCANGGRGGRFGLPFVALY